MRVPRTIAALLVSLSLAPVAALAQTATPANPAAAAPVAVEKKVEAKATKVKHDKKVVAVKTTDGSAVKAAAPAEVKAAEGSAVKQ